MGTDKIEKLTKTQQTLEEGIENLTEQFLEEIDVDSNDSIKEIIKNLILKVIYLQQVNFLLNKEINTLYKF